MRQRDLLRRLREGNVVQVLVVYLGVSWVVLQVVATLRDLLQLPQWIGPVAVVLLLIGIVIVLATAWIQSHPRTTERENAGEVPSDWELGVPDLLRSLRSGRMPHLNWGRALTGGVVALSLLIGVAGGYVLVQDRAHLVGPGRLEAAEAGLGVAVLPFEVGGGLDGVLAEGVMDLLATNIDAITGLRGMAPRAVVASGLAADPDRALELGRSMRAAYVVTGRVTSVGTRLRVVADVRDTRNGRRIGTSLQADGTADELLALADRLSVQVAAVLLREDPVYASGFTPAMAFTESPAALRAFLEGEAYLRRLEFTDAYSAYDRAVQADSTFAVAWARRGLAMGWVQPRVPEVAESFRRALASDRLPERDRFAILGMTASNNGDYSLLPTLRLGTQRYPDDPGIWSGLAEFYIHYGSNNLIPYRAGYDALLEAIRLQPDFYVNYIHAIEYAVMLEDTVRSAQLVAASANRLDAQDANALRLVHDIAFGTPEPQAAATAALDTLTHEGTSVEAALSNPRLLHLKEVHVRRRYEALTTSSRSARILATLLIIRGKFAEAHTTSESFATPLRLGLGLKMLLQGAPPPPAGWDALFRLAHVDTTLTANLMFSAPYAAERGYWDEHARALAIMRREEAGRAEAGDTAAVRVIRKRIMGVEGHAAWKRGQLTQARTLLAGALPDAGFMFASAVRYWLGEVHLALGDDDEALRVFETLRAWDSDWNDFPPRLLRIAGIHERHGRIDEARAALHDLVLTWRDADPGFVLAEEARTRLARLAVER
jgi:tetratricopeptide (TPR) repeat protein